MERIWTQGRRLGYEYTYKYGDWERVISRYRVSFERGTIFDWKEGKFFFFLYLSYVKLGTMMITRNACLIS